MSILEKGKAGIPYWLLQILGLGVETPRRCWVTLGPMYVIARSLVTSGVDWFHHICWVFTSTWSGYTGIPIPQKECFYTQCDWFPNLVANLVSTFQPLKLTIPSSPPIPICLGFPGQINKKNGYMQLKWYKNRSP